MTTRPFVAALALVVGSACGGAGTTSDTSSFVAVAPSEVTTSAVAEAAPSTVTTSAVVEVTEATPWAVELAEPTGLLLEDWTVPGERRPVTGDAPADVDAVLALIYADLIELWRDDRVLTLPMSDLAFSRRHREEAPSAVVDVVGTAAAMLADSYATIAEGARQAALPGTPGDHPFAGWGEDASAKAAAAEHLRTALADARSLPVEDQVCFLSRVDGDDECDGPGADRAQEFLVDAELLADAIDEIGIDDLGTNRAAGLDVDACAAWDRAARQTGLTDAEAARIWLAIDDHDLDVTFTHRSECHWEQEGIEDAPVDEAADRASVREYLVAVAAAVVDTGYDETSVEFGRGAEDERREYEYRSAAATTAVVDVARDVASHTWATVDDPALALTLYEVADLDIDDWQQLGLHRLAWDEVSVCDAWVGLRDELASELDAAQFSALDVTISELGIAGSLVPQDCD